MSAFKANCVVCGKEYTNYDDVRAARPWCSVGCQFSQPSTPVTGSAPDDPYEQARRFLTRMATKPYDTDVEALVDLFAEREMRAVDAERAAHSSKVDELAEQFRNEARTDLKAALERSEAQWFSEVGRLRDERNLEYDRAEKAAKALDEARSQLQRAVGLLRWLMSADDVKDADDPRYAEIRTLTSLPIPQESTTQEGGPK